MRKLVVLLFFIIFPFYFTYTASVTFIGSIRSATNNAPINNYTVFFRFTQPPILPPNFNINSFVVQTNSEGKYIFTLSNLYPNIQYSAEIYVYDKSFQIQKKSFSFYATNCSYSVQTIFLIPITPYNTKVGFEFEQLCSSCPAHLKLINKSTNNLVNSSLVQWQWKVDGQIFSTEKHANFFVFSSQLQNITLLATAIDTFSGYTFFSNVFTAQIPNYAIELFHIGGQIFQALEPVSQANAIIYANTCNGYVPLDTMSTVQYGYYYFTALPNCSYIVQAIPNNIEKNKNITFIPTYYQDKPFWTQAHQINLQNASTTQTINLIQIQTISGQFSAEGLITYSDLSPVQCLLFLHNEQMNIIQYNFSNKNGQFKFKNLSSGLYFISYEIPGLTTTYHPITINNTNLNNLHITIGNPSSYILENKQMQFKIYPNPCQNILYLTIINEKDVSSNHFLYSIKNLLGQEVHNGIVDAGCCNPAILDVSMLDVGLYHIEIKNIQENIYYTHKFIVVR